MYASDGGGGLSVPLGDPGALHAAASALDKAAGNLVDHGAKVRSMAVEVPGAADWTGAAAQGFTARTSTIGASIAEVEVPLTTISAAIRSFASALESAQNKARAALSAYNQAAALPPKQSDKAAADMDAAASACASAWSDLRAAAASCAGAINGAVGELPVVVDAPPQAVEAAAHAGSPAAQGWDWFHTWVMGWGSTGYGLLTTPSTFKAGAQVVNSFRSATQLPGDFSAMWSETVNSAGLAYDRGLITYDQLASRAEGALGAGALFRNQAATDVTAASRAALGVDGTGAFGLLSKGMLGLNVIGDGLTIADDEAPTGDRFVAGANLVGTGMVGAGALGLVGATSVIPVVGEVVMVGTGLYLTGSFIYHNWDSIKNWTSTAVDATGHFFTDTIPDTAGDVAGWADDNIAHPVEDAAGDVKDFFTDDVGGALSSIF